jgi:hypothetical protein
METGLKVADMGDDGLLGRWTARSDVSGLSLRDKEVYAAATILADALEDSGFSRVIEIRTAGRALRTALRDHCDETLEFAAHTFAGIDPVIRCRVLETACRYAADAAAVRRALPVSVEEARVALAKPPAPAKPGPKAASTLLKALNRMG